MICPNCKKTVHESHHNPGFYLCRCLGYLEDLTVIAKTIQPIKRPRISLFTLDPTQSMPTPKKVYEIAQFLMGLNPPGFSYQNNMKLLHTHIRVFYSQMIVEKSMLDDQRRQQVFSQIFGFNEPRSCGVNFKLHLGQYEPSPDSLKLIMATLDVILSTNSKVVDGFKIFDYEEVTTLVLETYRRTSDQIPELSDFLRTSEEMLAPTDAAGEELAKIFKTKISQWIQ
jgi:hypothetical protein